MRPALDAHAAPPQSIKNVYKHYQKCSLNDLDVDTLLVDPDRFKRGKLPAGLQQIGFFKEDQLRDIIDHFLGQASTGSDIELGEVPIYESRAIPGK